ncbi:MAG: sigma-70 family RNA polymerase sigma factor [Phycisphaerales bacterium]|nr:sigma-70 family RNA polymerase sigma factor [Phycisphaerales bacterium]MCB9856389.1 sigma-70 family RNA polymerase sigma factor [Phycisphaerales bacterium]MCB9864520.1 sigma-70 family RNA polymerase sigma factor [Phycisphaerales bacterium]
MADNPPIPESGAFNSPGNTESNGAAFPEASSIHDGAQPLTDTLYEQLRQSAAKLMHRERPDHTLSATVLVHDAFLRLAEPRDVPWRNRAHFYAAAAQAMRRVLIDHARARSAGRRGGPDARRAAIELSRLPDPDSEKENSGFLILDDAICRLEKVDPQAAGVVRLRYFTGLTAKETADVLNVSEPTVTRAWAFARAWLKETIERESES